MSYDFPPPPPRPWRGPRLFRYWRWLLYPAIGVVAVGVLLLGARFAGERVGDALRSSEIEPGMEVEIVIPSGAVAQQIAEILEEEGVIGSAREFQNAVVSRGQAGDLRAGIYQMTTGMEIDEAIAVVVAGPPLRSVYSVTIIEGLTISQILTSLAEQTPYTVTELTTALLGGGLSSSLLEADGGELTDWEGLLFPDTYQVAEDDPPEVILRRLISTMESRVDSIDWSRLDDFGVTVYEAITVASMIEREARLEEDRPLIASVIYNRLAIGQPLQIDATVLYAIGENKPVITSEDLAVDSPYNTYRQSGLPPTPISAPRLTSLQAAADPMDTGFFYYVLADPSGKHEFTETYDEFLAAKERAREDGLLGQ